MAFYHGVKTSELATSVLAPVQTTAGLPVIIGTAPVHLADEPKVNEPVICYSYAEAVKYLGYAEDWDNFTLCEAIYAEFQLYALKPVIFINVLDMTKHKKTVAVKSYNVKNKAVTITDPVILSSLTVKATADGTAATADTDYTAAYDDAGQLVITVLDGGTLASATTVFIGYDAVDASIVKPADIIGGVDTNDQSTGLELLDTIYARFSLVPGILAAPGWSEKPEIAAVMNAKSRVIISLFKCIALVDIDTEQVTSYSGCNAWKNNNGYTGVAQYVGWPMVKMGDHIYHMSTQAMGVIGTVDAANDDVPYQSPSNQSIQGTGLCLKDGSEITLTLEQANLLNSQGIVTALNFSGGWRLWGNYTGAYPGSTDVKDTFLCVRRMFDWDDNQFILTYWQKIDMPIIPRNIKMILDSEGIRLNGLVSRGFLLGASIEFLESENPTTDLLSGIIRFHKKRTPPVPAQEIESISEYDVSNFETLFNS